MQPIYNHQNKSKAYQALKKCQIELIEKSDIGSWNSLAATTRPSLQRILHLNLLIQSCINLPGDIFEFGCHYGASTCIMHNLLEIHQAHGRKAIHTFDTFEGFISVDSMDTSATQAPNKAGDFDVSIAEYADYLANMIELHFSLDSSASKNREFTIIKGDATKTLPLSIKKNPATLASLVIFDMDLHEPTLNCLELIKDRLVPGTIIVFDEMLAFKQFPGESIAYQECSFRSKLKPYNIGSNVPLVPFSSVFSYQP